MLLLASSVCGLFKWRQFEPEVILLAVGWYLRFSLSYRDVEELLAERGLLVDHVTVWRWVQRYAPELERRLRRHLMPTNDSWRVDETYVRVKGQWVYLYRAVDSSGATIDFLLSAKHDAATAQRFLTKASGGENHPEPRVINSDKHAAYPPDIVELKVPIPQAPQLELELPKPNEHGETSADVFLRKLKDDFGLSTPQVKTIEPTVFWKSSALIDRCNILITSWNRITGPSNAGCVQASIFAPSGQLGARSPATKRFI